MAINELISILIVLAALFAYVNHRWIKWPPTIGIMVLSLLGSLLLVIFGHAEKAAKVAAAIDSTD